MTNIIIPCACRAPDCTMRMSIDWGNAITVVAFDSQRNSCSEELTYTQFLRALHWMLQSNTGDFIFRLIGPVNDYPTFIISENDRDRLVAITKEQALVHNIAL